jgi:hypothetical protein
MKYSGISRKKNHFADNSRIIKNRERLLFPEENYAGGRHHVQTAHPVQQRNVQPEKRTKNCRSMLTFYINNKNNKINKSPF